MVVGPTSTGKSSIMNQVAKLDSRFSRVSGYVTRPPRDDDEPKLYRYINKIQANQLIASGQSIQHVIHPTTGEIYGSLARDYTSEFCMKDTGGPYTETYRKLPFKSSTTVSITSDLQAWLSWLNQRNFTAAELQKRLLEAKTSIEWSLKQTVNHYWIVNRPEKLEDIANEFVEMVVSQNTPTPAPRQATQMLRLIDSLLL